MKEKDRLKFGRMLSSDRQEVFRKRAGQSEIESGYVMEAKEGQPLPEGSEYIRATINDNEEWHEAETLYRHGPPQVATPAYRKGYDRIFGKQKVGLA